MHRHDALLPEWEAGERRLARELLALRETARRQMRAEEAPPDPAFVQRLRAQLVAPRRTEPRGEDR